MKKNMKGKAMSDFMDVFFDDDEEAYDYGAQLNHDMEDLCRICPEVFEPDAEDRHWREKVPDKYLNDEDED